MARRPRRAAPALALAALLARLEGAAGTSFGGQRGGARTAQVRPHGAPEPRAPAAEDPPGGAAPGGGTAAVAAEGGLAEARAKVAEPAAAGATRVLIAGATGLGPGDEIRITGPSGFPQDEVVVGAVQPGVASLVVAASGAIGAGGEGLRAVELASPLRGSFPAGSSVTRLARTAATMRREARPVAALDVGPTAPPKGAPTIMRWAWPAPGPAPASAPAAGWVWYTPEEEHHPHKEPLRFEDSAFLYYQFEPLEVRDGGHVIEIAELEILNNGHKVDLSGATANTPGSLLHDGGFSMSLLIDGNASSVWVDDWLEPITVQLPQPASADAFGFVTGGAPDHDPVKWKFRGSADGVRWTTLQHQSEGYKTDAKRLELQSFVFGETEPKEPAAAPAAPATTATAEVAMAGAAAAGASAAGAAAAAAGPPASEQAADASGSLPKESWSPADDGVSAASAAASRQAVAESAERQFEEAAGASQRKKEEEGSPDAALTACLSTLGALLLLAAGAAAAYGLLWPRPAAAEAASKGGRTRSEGEEDSERDTAAAGDRTGL